MLKEFAVKKVAKALPLLLLLTLSACPAPLQLPTTDIEQSRLNWARFTTLVDKAEHTLAPFNASLSIRYKTPNDGQRFGALFWSNLGLENAYPVRLDVQGAMGSIVVKIWEDSHLFIVYDTENNTALQSSSAEQTMLHLGLPLPVNLGDLAMLFNGRYSHFFFGQRSMNAADMPKPFSSNNKSE